MGGLLGGGGGGAKGMLAPLSNYLGGLAPPAPPPLPTPIPSILSGWMTCDFRSVSTAFQLNQDDGMLILEGFVQFFPIWDSKALLILVNSVHICNE